MEKIGTIKFTARPINVGVLKQNTNKLKAGVISPAKEETYYEVVDDHSADPIKSLDDIFEISDYLIRNERYRDNMLFIVGINFGLRVSDLRMLRFCNLINDNLTYKENFAVFEKKTRNTRKRKKNRYITINDAVKEAVTLFLEQTPGVSLSDFMFRSQSNRCTKNVPLSIKSIDRILKGIAEDLDLNIHMSTHTLRKTFCYWVLINGNNDQRTLLLLQRMLNHSSPTQTLIYCGLDAEEIAETYKNLCLGGRKNNCFSQIKVFEKEVV